MINVNQQDIAAVIEALRQLEIQRPGLKARLILYTDGDGAMVLEDAFKTFRAAVDFESGDDLLKTVKRLGEAENILADE